MTTDLHQMIGRIDERTEITLKLMKEFKDEFKVVADDHEKRLNSLEHDRSQAKGILYILGGVATVFGAILGKFF